MSYRIERLLDDDEVILSVSGRLHAEQVEILRELTEREKGKVVVDLREVGLVDRSSVVLLSAIEEKGIELRNCPGYIREWVARERLLSPRNRPPITR